MYQSVTNFIPKPENSNHEQYELGKSDNWKSTRNKIFKVGHLHRSGCNKSFDRIMNKSLNANGQTVYRARVQLKLCLNCILEIAD